MIYVVLIFVLLNGFFMLTEFGSILMKLKAMNEELKTLKDVKTVQDESLDILYELKGFKDDIDLDLTNQVLHEFMESNAKKKKSKKKNRSDLEGQNEFYDSVD